MIDKPTPTNLPPSHPPATKPLGAPAVNAPPPPIMQGEPAGTGLRSINEPPGSNTVPEGQPGGGLPVSPPEGEELPPLSLDSISPDTLPLQPAVITSVNITATGTGFGPNTVMIFDDEEVPTTVLSTTQLRGAVPTMDVAGEYDVELQRGEELSDVLTFEFVDAHAGEAKAKKPVARKPAKPKDAPRKKKGKR